MAGERRGRIRHALALIGAGLAGVVAGGVADARAPWPAADVARGSEEAFAHGLLIRQFRPRGPYRWMQPQASFEFRRLPVGPARLEVRIGTHAHAVSVLADGRVLGAIGQDRRRAHYDLDLRSGSFQVTLRAPVTRLPDHRPVSALLERVQLRHAPSSAPQLGVLLPFAGLGLLGAATAMLAGMAAGGAAVVGSLVPALVALALWPCGLLRSPYADQLFLLGAAGLGLAAAFARFCASRHAGSGPWAFGALLLAFAIQGIVATSPMVVTTDATFHANNVRRVTSGNPFLVSYTPHEPPFEIPYGSLFYLALVPLHRAGLDPVELVRRGAACSTVLASAALFLALARTSAPIAGLTVGMLQLLPISLKYFASGAVSTVVGQACITGFFAWWIGRAPGGAWLGGALLAAGGLVHLSSLILLTFLVATLWLVAGPRLSGRSWWLMLALGAFPSALYYAHFLGLILAQLPRLLEGAGQGSGAAGLWGGVRAQLEDASWGWGWPAIALAAAGLPRLRRSQFDRELLAYWLASLFFCVVAIFSPLEVRYVHALSVPVSIACATTLLALWRRGAPGKVATVAAGAFQLRVAASWIVEILLYRQR